MEAASESLESVIFAMQSAGILVPPTVDKHGDSRDEPNRLLWQITRDMIEKFMPGFMGSVVPPPPQAPVRVGRSTRSSTFPAMSDEWKNSTPFWRQSAPIEKVVRNAAALNGTYHRLLHDPLLSDCFCSYFLQPCVSVSIIYCFTMKPLGSSSRRDRCNREEDFQTKHGSSTWAHCSPLLSSSYFLSSRHGLPTYSQA